MTDLLTWQQMDALDSTRASRNNVPILAISVPDSAHALGIHVTTAWKMAKDGRLRVRRYGGRTMVPVSELRRLLGE